MIWAAISRYSQVAWSLLLSFGASLVTFLLMRAGRKRREAKAQKARLDHAKKVMETDIEIEQEHDERTEELAHEIEKKKGSSELSDPNRW